MEVVTSPSKRAASANKEGPSSKRQTIGEKLGPLPRGRPKAIAKESAVDDKRARSATVDYSNSDQVVRNTRRRKDEPAPAPAQPLEPQQPLPAIPNPEQLEIIRKRGQQMTGESVQNPYQHKKINPENQQKQKEIYQS
jgi:hypothetical protein